MSRSPLLINPTLCNRLKKEREALKLSQARLAEQLGVSEQSLRHYELGHTGVSEWLIGKAAKVFGCSPEYLEGKTDYRTYEDERKQEVGGAVSLYLDYQARRDEEERVIMDLFRLFFSCESHQRQLGKTVVRTPDGKQTVFSTRSEWEEFCVSFCEDAEKVFKYHLYEYRAKHGKPDKK